ncbi:MAG: bifunctional riboflavin kinase/FAD synthetase [Cyclobacteriaceae bacterium]
MRIFDSFEEVGELVFPVVTSGTFDGVHFGHQKILKNVSVQAKKHKGQSVVITYWPHPRFVLGKKSDQLQLLTTFEEKAKLIEECGIDVIMKVPFTRSFSQLSADEYIYKVLIDGLRTKKLIIGYDHKFGRNQEGSFEYLKQHENKLGFAIEEIARQDIEDVGVSSTKIRDSLLAGNVAVANEYLGRNYSITGLVTKGEQLGRKLGFPTANIYVPEEYKLIPGDGVYAVEVQVGNRMLHGMLNIGQRPTVSGRNKTIEVNLFNFNDDIYGLTVSVSFVCFLRKEQKFSGLDQLKNQLDIDKKMALEVLNKLD